MIKQTVITPRPQTVKKRRPRGAGWLAAHAVSLLSFALLLTISAAYVGALPDTVSVVSGKRELPIYCVNRDDNKISISFDAAWGGDKTLKILDILDEHGDEIFREADSIALEIDCDKEIVKAVFYYAEKYRKPVFAAVSNMSIAVERRDFLRFCSCFVCNQQEAGILFSDDYSGKTPAEMIPIISAKVQAAHIPAMIVTMGADGAVYANLHGESGHCPARKLEVKDTTGAGDAFCAGAAIGLTYGKGLKEACEIGAMLAASVIVTSESVCPRFRPRELGLDMDVED